MSTIVDLKDACQSKVRRFTRLLRKYNPAALPASALASNKNNWTNAVDEALEDLVKAIEELCSKHGPTIGSVEVGVWKETIERNEAEFYKFMHCLEAKTQEFSGPSMDPRVQAPGPVSSQRDPNDIQTQKIRAAQVEVDIAMQIIVDDGSVLSKEISQFDDWADATDNEVEVAMQKVDNWNEKMEKLRQKSFHIQRNTISFDLNEAKMRSSKSMVNALSSELDTAVDMIQFEDRTRCLYLLNVSEVAAVKFPTFGGKDDEDFSKFEKEAKKAFVSNRVRRDDQVSKLRECLVDHPRSMIHSSIDNIDEAWKLLKTLYGDAARVMKAKKAKLASLGEMPKDASNSVRLQAQIEWLLHVEMLLKDIFDISAQSVNMDRAAYSPDLLDMVTNLFSFHVQRDFAMMDYEDSKDKMSGIFEYILKMRSQRQLMLVFCENDEPGSDDEYEGPDGDDDRHVDPGGGDEA